MHVCMYAGPERVGGGGGGAGTLAPGPGLIGGPGMMALCLRVDT